MSKKKNKTHKTYFLENGDIEKSDALILTIVFSWFLSIMYFNPMLLSLLIGDEPLIAKISVIIFVIVINMMWLYGVYHSVNILFSYFIKIGLPENDLSNDLQLPVAVLYMSRNDFNENVCKTCIGQNYENFHVYICDDSDDQEIKEKIDLFCEQHKSIVSVIRRNNIQGYKAGNINNALSIIEKFYQYISVNDADTELPNDFLSKLMPLSILLDSAKEVIVYLITGKTYFPVTNNRSEIKENSYWLLIESLIGLGLIIFAFTTYNLWLLSLGMAFVLTRILGLWGNKRLVRALVPIPLIVTLAIMFFIGITILQNYL